MNLPTSLIAATLCALPIALPPRNPDAIERFLSQPATPLTSAITFRHLEATTRGGAMRGWVDACTVLDGSDMRYSVVGQGGSGAVRKRALIAALDGEVKARRRGEAERATLHPDNYEFTAADAADGLLRVAIRPRRSDTMLIRGSMYLASEDGDLVRVEGALVKAPSLWTRKVRVDRRYARLAGVRVPVSMTSTAQVLVVGASTFSMAYSYLAINGEPVVDPRLPPQARACAATSAGAAGAASQFRGATERVDVNAESSERPQRGEPDDAVRVRHERAERGEPGDAVTVRRERAQRSEAGDAVMVRHERAQRSEAGDAVMVRRERAQRSEPGDAVMVRRERAQRSEPRERSEAAKRRASERVGESEGRSPSGEQC